MNPKEQIVAGLSIDASGHATVDPSLHDVLFDLAIALEAPTGLPVDMEHVVAALVLASRDGELGNDIRIVSDNEHVIEMLAKHVRTVFARYGGRLGNEDS